MSKTEFDKLMDHEYDGIREYDNPLPSWWVGIFVLTILFALGYWVYYHMGGGGLSETDLYQRALTAYRKEQALRAANAPTVDEATLAKLSKDDATLQAGRVTFGRLCTPCHNRHGEGLVGPNLTDDYQIHGSTRMDIYQTVRDGVLAKGMQAWGKVLDPKQLRQVVAFVTSLRGTHVKGKAAEGNKVEPWGD